MKRYYTKSDILSLLKNEYPDKKENVLLEKVAEIHRALNTMDVAWRRSNKKFYGNVFSYDYM